MTKANPKVEWGYFAVTPRILRTQYKQLSHTEKWLYTCLKDLCGDKGMCYRALRVLAQETDLSIGNLSTGIRHLHEAGLIHAEKKRRSSNPTAKEVWHISIVDIWQSNHEYCSNFEHSAENVQEMNNNVQIMNEVALKRSISEQKRSNFDARRNNTEEQHIEERTDEEQESAFTSVHASLAPSDFLDENGSHFDEDDTPTVKAPAITLNGATNATSNTDRQHPHTPGRSVDRPATEETPVAIASIPGGTDSPPSDAPLHSQVDGAATASWIGSESRPSSEKVTQASQKPLSLKEDEPAVKPETAAQRKRRIEAREKEIWALVEAELHTKFSRTHRQSKANTEGMEHLIEDDTDDGTLRTALGQLSPFWIAQFNVKQFHLMIPGLLAAKAPTNNGKSAPAPDAAASARAEQARNWKRAFAEQRALVEAEQRALSNTSNLQA